MGEMTDAGRLSEMYGISVQAAVRLLAMAEGDAAAVERALAVVFGKPLPPEYEPGLLAAAREALGEAARG